MHEHETNEAFKKIMAIAGVAIANGEREVHRDGGYGSRSEYDAGVSAKYQTDAASRRALSKKRRAPRFAPTRSTRRCRGSSRRSASPRPSPR